MQYGDKKNQSEFWNTKVKLRNFKINFLNIYLNIDTGHGLKSHING